MFMKIKISCPCHCLYVVNENINSDKVVCPNCGVEYPYSDKLIAMLKLKRKYQTEIITQTNTPLKLFLLRKI